MLCNITVAIYSVSPFLRAEVRNDKVFFNFNSFRKIHSLIQGPIRTIPVHIGELINAKYDSLLGKTVEIIPCFQSRRDNPDMLTPATVELKVVMLSLIPKDQIEPRDIFWLLNWNIGLLGILVIAIILILKQFLSKQREQPIWTTVKLFLYQKFPTRRSIYDQILSISLVVFTFFLLSILYSLISTDLVIKEKPFMIDKLEDVLDPRASSYKPVWRRYGNLYTIFSKSSSQSNKQKIWQKALHIGLDKCLITDDVQEIMKSFPKYSQAPWVAFIYDLIAMIVKEHSCCLPGIIGPQNETHIGDEILAKELFMIPYQFKNDSCKVTKRSYLERRFQRVFEANLINQAQMDSIVQDSLHLYEKPPEKWKCMGVIDPFDYHYWQQVTMNNTALLFKLYMASLIICTIVLIGEILVNKLGTNNLLLNLVRLFNRQR